MDTHYQFDDLLFEEQFREGTFPPQLFTHEAHLRLAWIHIRRYGVEYAADQICLQIKDFDRLHGDGTKFHKTLTVAAVRAVYHFMQKFRSDNFADFIVEFPRLKHSFKELLDFHYTAKRLQNQDARYEYVEPDLVPFS
ncbi:MAG: hypothetical protein R2824_29490 [Saprospiraceae bacterium]|nr:hypothetical protein [Lewinella sp.]